MKKSIIVVIIICLIFLVSLSFAKTVRVKGGFTKTGTYKSPSYRTSPNRTKFDNWSTKGNVNPMTGKKGSVNPFKIK